jgi:hypothetical protein
VGKVTAAPALLCARARQGHRRAAPGSLSARSIQLAAAVAPSSPQRLQRMRGPKHGTVVIRPAVHIDRSFVTARRAGRSRTSHGRRAGAMLASVIDWWPSQPENRQGAESSEITAGDLAFAAGHRLPALRFARLADAPTAQSGHCRPLSIHRSSVSDDSGSDGNHENGRLALSASALASRAAHNCVAAS